MAEPKQNRVQGQDVIVISPLENEAAMIFQLLEPTNVSHVIGIPRGAAFEKQEKFSRPQIGILTLTGKR